MGRRQALELTACRHPSGERGAILMAAGIVAALVLTLSAAAVVQLSGGSLRGAFASFDTRQARGAASEGIELMIATWNQPQNRGLLVSGEDPESWTAGSLTSPCSSGGLPDPTALDLADGSWRDVVTGALADEDTDGRQFRLLSITYTASDGSGTLRALRRTATPGGGSSGDPIPPTGWGSTVNLLDPDPASSPPDPGANQGFLILEVEGREVRDGRVVANSRLTQEFEVLPKCCGFSLGSGGAGSLGADSRPVDDPPSSDPPGTTCPNGQDWVARGPTSSRLW